ncbi:MAG: hypothetical protein KA248_08495 [Kiritimatiellae bacterium]|nr:hypothetical protein [Kiritimatiellia bacterium]
MPIPEPGPERAREASRAARGVALIGAGQVVSTVLSFVLALAVPRLLGSRDYGNWAVFRSVIDFIALLCTLGTPAVLSQYYVEARARGQELEAGLIFKSVAVMRLGVGAVSAAAGFVLIMASRSAVMNTPAAAYLAFSVLARVAGLAPYLLLYAERRTGRIVVLNILFTALVPALVAAGYALGGFRLVPPACALGDGLSAAASWLLAAPCIRWPRGWLPGRRLREITSFGAILALAHTASMAYVTMAPYFMSLAGMSSLLIGRVGLAVRLQNILLGLLGTAGGALWPSITLMHETEGLQRSVVWQSLFCRLGGVLILAVTGLFLAVADWAVPWAWGPDFIPAIPVISLWFGMTLAFWVGMRYALVGQLMKTPGVVLKASFWMYAVFVPLFLAYGRSGSGVETVLALLGGTLAFMAYAIASAWRQWQVSLRARRLAAPLLITAGLGAFIRWERGPDFAWPALAVWAVLFAWSVFVSRSLRGYEARDIWQALRRSGACPAEEPG